MEHVAGMMSMNTHLKVLLNFKDFFDVAFLFIVEIWHYVHNGSVYTLSSIYCQTFSVSPEISDLVDLCPNLWCNSSKENFFLGIYFFVFDFSFLFTKIVFFFVRCALVSPDYVCCHWRKLCKTIYEKVMYVINSLM